MTPIPDQFLLPPTTGDLETLPLRRLRALAHEARRERTRIQQQAVSHGSSPALGERLAQVDALERACRLEIARRGRWGGVRRVIAGALGVIAAVLLGLIGLGID